MREVSPTKRGLPVAPSEDREALVLGRIMARESLRMAEYFRRVWADDPELALEAIWGADGARVARALEVPPERLDWTRLNQVAMANPEVAERLWEQLKQIARDELESGNFAADALDTLRSLWERARFLAAREAFSDELQPRGAVEQALVDTLVHAYFEQTAWIRAYHERSDLHAERIDTGPGAEWRVPRMDEADARREAFDFLDRFNRLFTRTLRAIDEHRRRSHVVVRNAGQVNVADQQVNVSANPRQ